MAEDGDVRGEWPPKGIYETILAATGLAGAMESFVAIAGIDGVRANTRG